MKRFLKWTSIILGIAMSIGTWQFSQGKELYIQSWLAHSLLHTAWVRTQASGHQAKPWPGAETWPLARLSIPHLNIAQIILSHADEGLSAYALGHSNSSVLPGELGNSVLNILHHDTHFDFLKQLRPGDMLILESVHSGRWHYQVSSIFLVDKSRTNLVEPSLNRQLTLVSCYPCTAGNNTRYVVLAKQIERMSLPLTFTNAKEL